MAVLEWLLDSDPSVRWQVFADLADASDAVVDEERSRVAVEGWGARLLSLQQPDGGWLDCPERPLWIEHPSGSAAYALSLLRLMGLDPASDAAQRAVALVRDSVRHLEAGQPFFSGESEACVNGIVLAAGAYFGEVREELVERLLGEQLDDGGWNCDAPESTRSSFHSTICVVEGLWELERSGAEDARVRDARRRGEEYLLARGLYRRLSTGEVADAEWALFSFPPGWHYDVLRALDYFRQTLAAPDARLTEALALVRANRDGDGRWPLQSPHPSLDDRERERWAALDVDLGQGEGVPSPWNTLRALRVLRWAGEEQLSGG